MKDTAMSEHQSWRWRSAPVVWQVAVEHKGHDLHRPLAVSVADPSVPINEISNDGDGHVLSPKESFLDLSCL